MTIDQISIIDAIGVDNVTGELVLTIIDHLKWGGNEHLLLLQQKLNTYLGFIESGELLKAYPDSKGRAVVISLVCEHRLSKPAEVVVGRMASIIQDAGMKLRCGVLGDS